MKKTKRERENKKEKFSQAGGVIQAVERLPSKSEALSSNPDTAKEKKKFSN
jgi:hypothetical protein